MRRILVIIALLACGPISFSADKASPPPTIIVSSRVLEEGRLAVRVVADAKDVGQIVSAKIADQILASSVLVPSGDKAHAEFIVPWNGGEVLVFAGDRSVGSVPALLPAKPGQLGAADFTLIPTVFSGDSFPAFKLHKQLDLEKLLGPIKLEMRFYDAAQNEVSQPRASGRYGIVYDIVTAVNPPIRRYQTVFKLPGEIHWRTAEMNIGEIELPKELGLDQARVRAETREVSQVTRRLWEKNLANSKDAACLLAGLSEGELPLEPPTWRNNAWRRNLDWWYNLLQKIGDWKQYDYLVYPPKQYEENTTQKWPLLLFLHGYGDGDTRELLKKWGPPRQIAQGRDLPFLVVAPRSPRGSAFEAWYAPQLGLLLDEVISQYRVDSSRIYVTGLSMGGNGTWRMASEFPQRIAAIAPFCGSWDEEDAARIAHIPTWIFHGEEDKAEPVQSSTKMRDALLRAGGRPKATIYPGVGHVCWEEAYSGDEFYSWLLEQRITPEGAPKPITK